jgi:hypothetical protein
LNLAQNKSPEVVELRGFLTVFSPTRRTCVRGRAKENAFNIQIEQILKLVELQDF